jgi:hypothetical protein
VRKLLVLLFWCCVFLVFLTPMELGDSWWHLGTGKWIWEHRALPEADPFSISSTGERGSFVLRGFWLFQLALYFVQSAFGINGLIALKALAFTLTFSVMSLTLKTFGLSLPFRLTALVPAVFIATYYDEIRPQTLSFLLFALTLHLLELSRRSGHGGEGRFRPHMLLPAVMLLWANMYPGFIIGDLVIAAYLAEAILRSALKKPTSFPVGFIVFCLAALMLSALNPNGLEAIARTKSMIAASAAGTSSIHEHRPVKEFASFTQQSYLYPAITAFIITGLLSFIIRIKRPDVLHLILFCAFSYISLTTFRAGFFFALTGTVAIGKNLSGLRQPGGYGRPAIKGAAGCVLLLLAAFALLPRTVLRTPVMDRNLFPVKASAFIEEAALPGNLYHPYEWGGYLIWRLYPGYKVFIDGRAMGPMDKHRDVLTAAPRWKKILDEYAINTIMYWPLLPYEGNVPPLLFALLDDKEWSPVYWDLQSVVFVRSALAERPLRKNAIWELFTSLISANIIAEPGIARNYSALGEAYLHRGLKHDAGRAFSQALALDPGDRKAAFWLRTIELSQ